MGVLQDPYYDGSWQIPFSSEQESPAIGSNVILKGTVGSDGTLAAGSITISE